MQLGFGAVYGWSVFLNPLREQFGAGKAETNLTFTITLAVIGVTAAFGGGLQRRITARSATATVAGLLYGGGVILSGFAPDLTTLYLCYGIIGGIGWPRLHRSARRPDHLVPRQARLHHRPRGHGLRTWSSGHQSAGNRVDPAPTACRAR